MFDENPIETYTELLKAINPLQLAYVHSTRSPDSSIDVFKLVRTHYDGISIVNGDFDFASGEEAIKSDLADLVAYATHHIANPDLVARFRHNLPLSQPDTRKFYTPGPEGYIDYPKAAVAEA